MAHVRDARWGGNIDIDQDTMTCLLVVSNEGDQQRWQSALESIMRKR